MVIVAKRTVMSLFSEADDVYSHQVRIVLAEKGVNVDIISVQAGKGIPEISSINPYDSVPTLIDRELVLYEARIIMEYLDERFPHPPLLPVYPVARAEFRKNMYRIERDWYSLMHHIQREHRVEEAREALKTSLVELGPIFADKPYFLSDEYSLLDCVLGPLLWRLPQLGVTIPADCEGLSDYMQRLFQRDTFQASLTETEKQARIA